MSLSMRAMRHPLVVLLLLLLAFTCCGIRGCSGQQVTVAVWSSGSSCLAPGTSVSRTLSVGVCSPNPDPSLSTYVRIFCVGAGTAAVGALPAFGRDSVVAATYADSSCSHWLATLLIAPGTCSSGLRTYSCTWFSTSYALQQQLPMMAVASTGSYSVCDGNCNPQCGTIYMTINTCVVGSPSSSLFLSCTTVGSTQQASVLQYNDGTGSCSLGPASRLPARTSGQCVTQASGIYTRQSSVVTCPSASVAPTPTDPVVTPGAAAAADTGAGSIADKPVWNTAVTICFGCGVGVALVAAILFLIIHQWDDCCSSSPQPDSWESRPRRTQPAAASGEGGSAFFFSLLLRVSVLGAMIAALVLDDWTSESWRGLKYIHAGVLALRVSLLGQSDTLHYSSCHGHALWCALIRGGGLATLIAGILTCVYSAAGLARVVFAGSFSRSALHRPYQLDLLASVAASATCLFWSTVTHGMLVFAEEDTSGLTVDLSLSCFLAMGAAGVQLLLTAFYTRAVWRDEATRMRDQQAVAAGVLYGNGEGDQRSSPPLPAASHQGRTSIQLSSVVPSPSVAVRAVRDDPLEAAMAASLADEQARRRVQEDEEFAAILTVRPQVEQGAGGNTYD